jgi:S-(hydroxymethyl)glutathione dehydrogenase/alcohol dehydrogenase
VVVIGCGGVGLNVVQGAVLAAASRIIAVDKLPFKLEKAGELGATHFINADKEDVVKRVQEITNGGADYAFEVVGLPQTVRQAFECIRSGGTAMMVGVPPTGADISIPAGPLFQDRTLMGTFYGAGRPRVDFPWLLDLYMAGRLKLDELITRTRPLEEVNEAFEDMVKGVATRTILTFD